MKKLMFLIVAVLFTATLFGQTTLKIGQHYQGGVIFYIDATGEHGLIAPETGFIPISIKDSKCWYNNQCMWGAAPIEGVGTDTRLGTGKRNTELMMKRKSEILPYISAAEFCTNFSVTDGETTYKDWFLPSKDEMVELLKLSKLPIWEPNFVNYKWYGSFYFHARFWTSSECVKGDKFWGGDLIPDSYLKYYVWIMQFGYMLPNSKGQAVYVIPVRQF